MRRCAVMLALLAVPLASAGGLPPASSMVLNVQDFTGATLVSARARPSLVLPPLAASSAYTNTFTNAVLDRVTLSSVVSTALVAKDESAAATFAKGLLAELKSADGRSTLVDSVAQILSAKERAGITASAVARARSLAVGDAAADIVVRFTTGGSTFDVGELWIAVGQTLSLTLYREAAPGLTAAQVRSLARLLAFRASQVAAPRPANTGPPLINGTLGVAKPLDADPGVWSNGEELQFQYQWLRCNPAGAACVAIPGANYSSYAVAPADEGSTLVVAVTALSPSGVGMARSQPTAVVP